jgi:hypothetical protein
LSNWEPRINLPYIQVRHKSLILYSLPADNYSHRRSDFKTLTYSGKVTSGSGKRIRKAVDLLLQLSPLIWITNPITKRRETHTLSFITLTIPEQEHKPEANEGHRLLLKPWLLKMKRKTGLSTYIWKAEFQKNGMLHYHITTRSWILYTLIRDEWNNLLSSNGFLTEHFAKHGNIMPNSTDVHKVYQNKKLENYLQKEISKTQQNKTTKGKVWDCSLNLKQAKFFSDIQPSYMPLLSSITEIITTDHCTILKTDEPMKVLPTQLLHKYQTHLKAIPIT